jgi:hypothetical protein
MTFSSSAGKLNGDETVRIVKQRQFLNVNQLRVLSCAGNDMVAGQGALEIKSMPHKLTAAVTRESSPTVTLAFPDDPN